ncbi:uncharacterized protein LOC125940865 [Dermacentor silvarum]|uniref:uncharacterized protein LOC125940865 n=1 Tax=Dermacentor silvarum TaxID=543639 RepID=UPI00210190E5|nr:uncharacterized protein LOC125940865 [Dermacentor silvarum]
MRANSGQQQQQQLCTNDCLACRPEEGTRRLLGRPRSSSACATQFVCNCTLQKKPVPRGNTNDGRDSRCTITPPGVRALRWLPACRRRRAYPYRCRCRVAARTAGHPAKGWERWSGEPVSSEPSAPAAYSQTPDPTARPYCQTLLPDPTARPYGQTLRPDPTARPYGQTLRPDSTARLYGQTLRPDSTARLYGQTLRPDSTARLYGQTLQHTPLSFLAMTEFADTP